ncbi:hypothetical protein BDN70DRAFT_884806 [Pholiota conissans]|uniref:Uncharacterized protein n=1 Tax=Pholiota conissans TaxID=109636 RepID=A0A9P6CPB2_9AGAR|nr:hypothetical protein BDN70DRAFT_884806 [Pholiota conissans]
MWTRGQKVKAVIGVYRKRTREARSWTANDGTRVWAWASERDAQGFSGLYAHLDHRYTRPNPFFINTHPTLPTFKYNERLDLDSAHTNNPWNKNRRAKGYGGEKTERGVKPRKSSVGGSDEGGKSPGRIAG